MATSEQKSRPVLLALLASTVIAGLAACSQEPAEPGRGGNTGGPGGPGGGQRQMTIPAVEAVQAQRGALPLEERLTGRVSARNQTEIYPEVSGPVTEIYVDNGDYVNAGDPLVQLRDSEYVERYEQAVAGLDIARAQTRQAEANLQQLENQARRVRELTERQLETTANLETIEVQVAVASANMDLREAQENQARSQLEERRLELVNTTVRAPISGLVGLRNAERGQMASTGTPLFLIGDVDQVRIEILLTERMLNYIREGMSVNLYSENWPGTMLDADISRISPFLDPETLRTEAYIDMANPDNLMRPGMFVNVDVLYGETEQAVLIPNSAIYRHPRTGVEGVYVMNAPGEELRPVADVDGAPAVSPPMPVSFVAIDVIAAGRMASGVRGVNEGQWVITVGQNMLVGAISEARARLMPWDRIMEMQRMQSRDIFNIIEQSREDRQALSDS
ncbi:efflux RND transporter periplasmic adaptor subunit [Pseudohongiella acticola]|uniref:efflux RND transporter periplasmic adaptor subunit n=1 Tax=Pseudohongiella acticola TaxID=1524254 RepID=UPI0009F238CC|nr:efflux RND transporter periplasmic adaptor subunit [Pseudohongiella acticola]